MAQIYISIGSNIDAEHNIRGAVDALRRHFGELQLSSVYESESIGFEGDNFLNLVVGAQTTQPVQTVLDDLHAIENHYGRVRSGPRFSSRTLDLDLLLYDEMDLRAEGIDIPREEITHNAFVLQPLAEIAPQLKHPRWEQTMEQMWQQFDKESQSLWSIPFDWE